MVLLTHDSFMVPDKAMSGDRNRALKIERRNLLRSLGVAGGAGLLAGCLGGDSETPNMIAAGMEDDIGGLDPHTMAEDTSWRVNYNLYEGVLRRGPGLEMEPVLAEDWSISDDGMTYTFDLREGVMFHPPVDREMVADDVVYSWERVSDPDVSGRAGFWDPVGEIYEEDDYTVVIEMDDQSDPFQFSLNEKIMPRDAPDDYDLNEESVGTGPFMFDEHSEGDFVRIVPHEDYWREDEDGNQLPYVDEVEFSAIPEGSTRATAIQTGEIDALSQVPMSQIESIEAEDEVTVHTLPSITFDYITFDMSKDVLDDRSFRQAVAWSIDREDMVEAGHFGYSTPAHTPVNPETELAEAIEVDEDLLHEQDFDRAQEYLDESDYDGEEFEILCVTGSDPHVSMSEVLNENLREIGVETTINALEQEEAFDRALFGPHDFEIFVHSWGGIIDPDNHTAINLRTEEDLNQPGYGDEDFDDLIDAARQAPELEERAELYGDIFEQLLEDVPYIYLGWEEAVAAVRDNLSGYTAYPFSAATLKFEETSVEE